jgi:hypothetical protein
LDTIFRRSLTYLLAIRAAAGECFRAKNGTSRRSVSGEAPSR